MADAASQPDVLQKLRRAVGDPILVALLFCLIVSLFFLAFPAVDLRVSSLFYDPATGFPAARVPALRALRASGDIALWLVVLILLFSVVLKIVLPWRRSLVPANVSLFLLAGLALGPGLVVNAILKDHWGRPRPLAIDFFGGTAPYVDVWRVTDYCIRNCSFVAGEASSAAWLVALTLVVPRHFRLPTLLVTGVFAIALSLNRIVFGGHFLSDVLLSWGLTGLVIAVLYRLIFISPPAWLANDRIEAGLARLGNAIRRRFGEAGREP
ncbi:MAG: phosphatase PAP2 family protein [Bauldia sp.]